MIPLQIIACTNLNPCSAMASDLSPMWSLKDAIILGIGTGFGWFLAITYCYLMGFLRAPRHTP